MLDVFSGVVQVLEHVLGVGVEESRAWSLALLKRHGPRAVLNAGRDVTGKSILLSD